MCNLHLNMLDALEGIALQNGVTIEVGRDPSNLCLGEITRSSHTEQGKNENTETQ